MITINIYISRRIKLLLVFAIIIYLQTNAQVGIGTKNPTRELDIVGNVRIRGLESATGESGIVSILPDGTLSTVSSQERAIGVRFIGFLSKDMPLDSANYSTNTPPYAFEEIIVDDELMDIRDEYNTITGRYVPKVEGVFKVSSSFDIGDYFNEDNDIDILIGLWDFTEDKWVLRRTFQHHNSNINWYTSGDDPDSRNETFSFANYIDLKLGHSYGFRIVASYDDSVTNDFASLKSKNDGGTGASLSSIFSIEKVR